MMYRVYLRTLDQQVLNGSKTTTRNQRTTAKAFTHLVNRSELDGQTIAAVLTFNDQPIAVHRFDRELGHRDYWRMRLDEISWPIAGHPSKMEGGKRVNVYLDAASLCRADVLGKGNISEGIRIALQWEGVGK
jgi:hypothetical protein